MQIRNFSKIGDAIEAPNLAELQVAAYGRFLQPDLLPHQRQPIGLEAIFREIFPIISADGAIRMEYLGYELGLPYRSEEECRHLGLSYCCPLRLRLRIGGAESVEEDVYMADVPKMIGCGEFIINGSERVVVSQIQRSAGVDFDEIKDDSGQTAHSCRFIPERGTWIEFTIGRRDVLQVRLGQSGRLPATWLLRAMLGPDSGADADILALFYEREDLPVPGGGKANSLEGRYLAGELVNPETGEVIARAGARISRELSETLAVSGMKDVAVLKNVEDKLVLNTLESDPCKSHAEAVLRIYQRFRPGEPATLERATELFAGRFAEPSNYSLGRVGRFRVNQKFQHGVPLDRLTLCRDDILCAIRYLIRLREKKEDARPDDIDDLGNRVLKPIDKLLELPVREACVRWRRSVRERLVTGEGGKLPSPREIAGTRALAAVFEEFFGRGELSQVVDQTNPLAELNHVRRISALGPGGLNRKRAGFEVRDVHASHYGRICPIETPEGANIGLIASLGIFARVDEYGFITTPFRTLRNGSEVRYLRADEERDVLIAPAGCERRNVKSVARARGEFREARLADIHLEDVSPRQIVGVSASLIPFLEHNDANRALMGSNMQRQAVPLQQSEPALVVTGMESAVARSSGMVVIAEKEGTVAEVDGSHITIAEGPGADGRAPTAVVHPLRKYVRLSENTCLNQRPIVREGDSVAAGQVIADGAATFQGELSLGKNVLAAFMIWDGYNFEDAIIVSDSLIQADKYTSIHIEEFTAVVRETRLGHEEFTRDIPNVSERTLANLDDAGIVRVGTTVRPGDILVGKVVPKTKAELTPEEKLLREIFGKAGIDVANESLTVPPGTDGVVIHAYHYKRKTQTPDDERRDGLREARKLAVEYDTRLAGAFAAMMRELAGLPQAPGQSAYRRGSDQATIRELLHEEELFRFDPDRFAPEAREQASRVFAPHWRNILQIKADRDREIRRLRSGDELQPGVLEMVKIFVAVKRPLSVGDKMAGRHGNKGVIARIVPREDMPYLPDGTPIDVILNPLGVPSRMNVGQILETHLGWAGRTLGFRALSPVFDGATEAEIHACLREAGLPEDGKTVLYDGRTGEPFDQKVTVGYIYIMKLNHLVDEKIHARATGPYSMVTQQPLGGKARMGGQRLGEMEVWALEAYGAAHLLQEMMTVKSDDTAGRTLMYESIIKGRNCLEAGTPVSFDVLVQEVRGLGMNLRLEKAQREIGPQRR
ncbi:MAG: DNA-directed RNA polymerase subunit beta [Candidatus Brocadiia bacterium]